jgi:hypothetical protein
MTPAKPISVEYNATPALKTTHCTSDTIHAKFDALWDTTMPCYNLLGCIPIPCTLGINNQVNLQDVGTVEGLRHALNHYDLGHISRLCRSFQYHFIMHLKDGAFSF